jgi:PIF1-like helicase
MLPQYNTTRLRNIREKFSDCYCIIIDEISMVGSGMFYKISKRLQEVMNNNLRFGGKNILVLGDFSNRIIKNFIAPTKKS